MKNIFKKLFYLVVVILSLTAQVSVIYASDTTHPLDPNHLDKTSGVTGSFTTNLSTPGALNGPDINDLAIILPSYIHFVGSLANTYGQVVDLKITVEDLGNGNGELLSSYDFQLNTVRFFCGSSASDCTAYLKYELPTGTTNASGEISINPSLPRAVFDISFDSAEYMRSLAGKSLPEKIEITTLTEWVMGSDADRKYVLLSYRFPVNFAVASCSQYIAKDECEKSCVWSSGTNKCYSKTDEKVCNVLKADASECSKSAVCSINSDNRCELTRSINTRKAVDQIISNDHPKPDGYEGPLPECAFSGSCRDINVLVELGLRVMNYIFSIVAGLAFVFFIYGGFTWIFSFGNSEKIKKGQQIFVYAIIGLVIVFSAYVLVKFLLDALNVSNTFRGIF